MLNVLLNVVIVCWYVCWYVLIEDFVLYIMYICMFDVCIVFDGVLSVLNVVMEMIKNCDGVCVWCDVCESVMWCDVMCVMLFVSV